MKKKYSWKIFFSYYKPYKALFFSDMFFAVLGAGVTLVIPLIVRYITGHLAEMTSSEAAGMIVRLGCVMVGLVAVEAFCNFYIAYFGHMMGAKMERDMRNEIFAHYQRLSFSFYDEEKLRCR